MAKKEIYIATQIDEFLNYERLKYYHYLLMEYLNKRLGNFEHYKGYVETYDSLPIFNNNEGDYCIVKQSFSYKGKTAPNYSTVIWGGSKWMLLNEENKSYDVEWNPIGNDMNYRKMFSIPLNTSIIFAYEVDNKYTDLVFYTNKSNSDKTNNLITLSNDNFAIFYNTSYDNFVGLNRPVNNTNNKFKIKILYFTGNVEDITWYNKNSNNATGYSKTQNNLVLFDNRIVYVDSQSSDTDTIICSETGVGDHAIDNYEYLNFYIKTDNIGSNNKVSLNLDGYENSKESLLAINNKVKGLTISYNNDNVLDIEEELYGGDIVSIIPNNSVSGMTIDYKIYRSKIISDDKSIAVERTSTGGYNITTNGSGECLVTSVNGKTGDVLVEDLDNKVEQIIEDEYDSITKYTSVKSVVDYINKEKTQLKNYSIEGKALRKFLEVKPKNNTAYYRLVAMFQGTSANPDYFKMMELSFGYNRPNNYCEARWIAYDDGEPKNRFPYRDCSKEELKVPEIHIYIKEGTPDTLVIAGKCPESSYQGCYLYVLTEHISLGELIGYNQKSYIKTPDTQTFDPTGYEEIEIKPLSIFNGIDEDDKSLADKGILPVANSEIKDDNIIINIYNKTNKEWEELSLDGTIYESGTNINIDDSNKINCTLPTYLNGDGIIFNANESDPSKITISADKTKLASFSTWNTPTKRVDRFNKNIFRALINYRNLPDENDYEYLTYYTLLFAYTGGGVDPDMIGLGYFNYQFCKGNPLGTFAPIPVNLINGLHDKVFPDTSWDLDAPILKYKLTVSYYDSITGTLNDMGNFLDKVYPQSVVFEEKIKTDVKRIIDNYNATVETPISEDNCFLDYNVVVETTGCSGLTIEIMDEKTIPENETTYMKTKEITTEGNMDAKNNPQKNIYYENGCALFQYSMDGENKKFEKQMYIIKGKNGFKANIDLQSDYYVEFKNPEKEIQDKLKNLDDRLSALEP